MDGGCQAHRCLPASRRHEGAGRFSGADVELAHLTFGYGGNVLSDFSMQGGHQLMRWETGSSPVGCTSRRRAPLPVDVRITERHLTVRGAAFLRVPGTVLEQITLGDPQMKMVEIYLRDNGRLRHRLQRWHLSQGEWQLLSIPFLLRRQMDEVTANLDAETEAAGSMCRPHHLPPHLRKPRRQNGEDRAAEQANRNIFRNARKRFIS